MKQNITKHHNNRIRTKNDWKPLLILVDTFDNGTVVLFKALLSTYSNLHKQNVK